MVCCARFWDKVWPFFQAVCRAVRGERYAPDLRGIAVHTFGGQGTLDGRFPAFTVRLVDRVIQYGFAVRTFMGDTLP